jgi:hypothetical protein
MSSTLYEIVELPNGDIVLQRTDDAAEPLVSIRFSADSLSFMREGKFDVAKAMIEAGMEAAGELADQSMEDIWDELEPENGESPVLH